MSVLDRARTSGGLRIMQITVSVIDGSVSVLGQKLADAVANGAGSVGLQSH